MTDANEHITAFCHAFLRPEKRERLAALLAGKRRGGGMDEMAHPAHIDPRHAAAWTGSDASQLVEHLQKLGAPDHCYVLSNYDELNDRWMELPRALHEIFNIGSGTIVSCLPGTLAYFKGEYGEHLVLQRRAPAVR